VKARLVLSQVDPLDELFRAPEKCSYDLYEIFAEKIEKKWRFGLKAILCISCHKTLIFRANIGSYVCFDFKEKRKLFRRKSANIATIKLIETSLFARSGTEF
jgi:hypothetical protein